MRVELIKGVIYQEEIVGIIPITKNEAICLTFADIWKDIWATWLLKSEEWGSGVIVSKQL